MQFVKAEGLGNDFVLVESVAPSSDQIRRWCHRRTGIGADGVLQVTRSDGPEAVARMRYWNADGSVAGMCGNGLRCVARYVYERGWPDGRAFTIRTATGLNRAEIIDDSTIRVELGAFRVDGRAEYEGRYFTTVDVGNPHAVALLPDPIMLEEVSLAAVGRALQNHPLFPSGVNVELAAPISNGWRVRVWERGAGATLACGTGAAAVAAVAQRKGLSGHTTEVELPGGTLGVDLIDEVAWISGPATLVFSGDIPSAEISLTEPRA